MTAIDRDIPMPDTNRTKYPWADLAIGDSFVHNSKLSVARVHAYQTGRRMAPSGYRKFTAAEVDGVVRVWRTA